MKARTDVFERMPIPRALAEFAVPMIISQLVTLAYNLADTFYLGRTGNPYVVAAASLVLPVFNMTVAIANLFGTGGGSLISRLLGVSDEDEAGRVSAFSFWFALLAGIVFSAVCLTFMDPLLRALGASSETFGFAKQYASIIIVIGGVPTVLTLVMANLVRSVGMAKQSAIGVSLGGILNIFLDPLFMFVLLPKGNEVAGAAIATMLSNVASMTYFVLLIVRSGRKTALTLGLRTGMPRKKSVSAIFSVGVPASLMTFLYDISSIVIDMLAAGHGDITVAAMGIVLKAERLPLNIGIGICQGMMPIVAYNYAAGNYGRMRGVLKCARFSGFCVSVVSMALYELFAGSIMKVFINDAETVALGTGFIRARCLATFCMFMCFNFGFFFQAIGQGKVALIQAVIRQLVFNIPLLLLMDRLFGVRGIVWTQLLADSCTAAVSFVIMEVVEKKIIRPREAAAVRGA